MNMKPSSVATTRSLASSNVIALCAQVRVQSNKAARIYTIQKSKKLSEVMPPSREPSSDGVFPATYVLLHTPRRNCMSAQEMTGLT